MSFIKGKTLPLCNRERRQQLRIEVWWLKYKGPGMECSIVLRNEHQLTTERRRKSEFQWRGEVRNRKTWERGLAERKQEGAGRFAPSLSISSGLVTMNLTWQHPAQLGVFSSNNQDFRLRLRDGRWSRIHAQLGFCFGRRRSRNGRCLQMQCWTLQLQLDEEGHD